MSKSQTSGKQTGNPTSPQGGSSLPFGPVAPVPVTFEAHVSTLPAGPVEPQAKVHKPYTPARSAFQPFDLDKYLFSKRLSPEAERYVREAIASPSRSANGYLSNTVRYPIHRFGHTVELESRSIEFPYGLISAQRPEVLAVLEQPPKVFIKAHTASGRPFSIEYTPDFLVITPEGIEIHEVRPFERMAVECAEKPHRYQMPSPGVYDSKPVRKYFENLGFSFRIATQRNIHGPYFENAVWLHPYTTGRAKVEISQAEYELFVGCVRANPSLRLSEIPIEPASRRAELAFHFLAKAEVFTHLSEADFSNPQTLRLYPTIQDEVAFRKFRNGTRLPRPNLTELGYYLKLGSLVEFKGIEYKVTRLTDHQVVLTPEDGEILKMPLQQLLDLRCRIGGIYNAEMTFEAMFRHASIEDRAAYAKRKHAIAQFIEGGSQNGKTPKDRSVRRWLAKFKNATSAGRCGDSAIFPKFYQCGKRGSRLDPRIETELTELIRTKYRTAAHCDANLVHQLLVAKFGGTIPEQIPDVRTIYRRVRKLNPYRVTKDREGKRSAMKYQPIYPKSEIALPAQGQKSWELGHIDCSKIDLRLVDKDTYLIRASLVDAFDGRFLASVIWDGAPNGMLIRELILECLERHGTLPTMVAYDWGTENNTCWMADSMAMLGTICQIRPKADPRKGAPVESSFSKECRQLFHNLQGNTELLKNARMVTKAVNPTDLATWREAELRLLVKEYHELCNDLPREDRASPNAIALECERRFGAHPLVGFSRNQLRKILLPFVSGFRRRVSTRGTIRCDGKDFYSLDLVPFAGMDVDVRRDPEVRTERYVRPPGRAQTITCTVSGRGFDDQEILEDAKRFDEAKVSPMPGIPYAAAQRANFAAKTEATQERLKVEKRRRSKAPPIPPRAAPTVLPALASVFNFESYSRP